MANSYPQRFQHFLFRAKHDATLLNVCLISGNVIGTISEVYVDYAIVKNDAGAFAIPFDKIVAISFVPVEEEPS